MSESKGDPMDRFASFTESGTASFKLGDSAGYWKGPWTICLTITDSFTL